MTIRAWLCCREVVVANISAYETAHGRRWEVRYLKPDGKSSRKRGFVRRRDAELWMAEHVTAAKATDSFVSHEAGMVTVGQLYEQYTAERLPIWKPSQARTVDSRWRTHIAPTFADIPVNRVTRAMLQQWVSGLAATRSASLTCTTANIMAGIMQIAVRDRRIVTNPMEDVTLPRRARRKSTRTYLTVPQLMRFADECLNGTRLAMQRRAIVLLLGFCGLRWGEMCALRVGDVDYERGRVEVRANLVKLGEWTEGSPKNGQARSVPIPRVVADALLAVTAGRPAGERVFVEDGHPPRPQSVTSAKSNRTWYVSALRRAGVPLVSPHELRHTAASIAVHAGANVKALQRMLGHATASMTLDVYADLFDSDLDDVARMVDAVISVECPVANRVQTVSKSDDEAVASV